MKILIQTPYGFDDQTILLDEHIKFLPRVGEYILCDLNKNGLLDYPNKSPTNNQIELIVNRVSHDISSGYIVIDMVQD